MSTEVAQRYLERFGRGVRCDFRWEEGLDRVGAVDAASELGAVCVEKGLRIERLSER